MTGVAGKIYSKKEVQELLQALERQTRRARKKAEAAIERISQHSFEPYHDYRESLVELEGVIVLIEDRMAHVAPDALSQLLMQSRQLQQQQGKPVIVVGAMAERGSGRITYGGRVADSSLRRFNYRMVWSATEPMRCDVIEGNCVLIPREIALRVGNLDPVFEHAMGDTDYGLRVGRAGFGCFVSAGVIGYCSDNPVSGTHSDTSLSLRKRWRLLLGRKGLPVRSWLHFTRRHGGPLWPLYFSWPYARLLWSGLRGSRA